MFQTTIIIDKKKGNSLSFYFIYGVGRLQQKTTCVFNQFQSYDNIAEKGFAGGLKINYLGALFFNDVTQQSDSLMTGTGASMPEFGS